MTKPDFGCLLRALTEHGVDFLVVGGVGAILQGVNLSGFDLDIVHSMEPANITRLLAVLGDFGRLLSGTTREAPEPNGSLLSRTPASYDALRAIGCPGLDRQGTQLPGSSAACRGNDDWRRCPDTRFESGDANRREGGNRSRKGHGRSTAPAPRTRRIAPETRPAIKKARSRDRASIINRATSYSPTHLRAQYHRG